MIRRFALVLLPVLSTLTLGACSYLNPDDDGPDEPKSRKDPATLSVRQSPNDTVRVGTLVTYTAVFPDSLNQDYDVNWVLVDRGIVSGRTVTWQAPNEPGRFIHELNVSNINSGLNGHYTGFVTVVVP